MTFVLGRNCTLEYKTGGVADSGSWVEVENVRDVNVNLTSSEADVTTRNSSGWKQSVQALRDASVSFEMVFDDDDTDFQVFWDAYFGATVLGVRITWGDSGVAGNETFEFDCMVTECTSPQPLEDAVKSSITIKPTYSATAPSQGQTT